MSRGEPGPVPLRRVRLMLRAKRSRLWRDIQRLGALYPTPHIERQLADWKDEYAQTRADLLGVERRIARGEK